MDKNKQIAKTRRETKLRRKTQKCFTREVKLSNNKLNSTTKLALAKLYLEAKWFYNYILSQDNVWDFDTKTSIVSVRLKNGSFEERKIENLSSQMKQSIHTRIKNAIIALSKLPPEKRGKLKHKREVTSIPLKQFGVTFRILNNKYIQIQGIKQKIKVAGLNQILQDAEIASATLINKVGSYFLKITYFVKQDPQPIIEEKIGLDFGIETDITFSNGIKLNTKKPILKTIIRDHKNLSRKTKGSKNYVKAKKKLQKSYNKQNNQKKDKRDKIISILTHNFQVVVQDENIKGWNNKIFGKSIQQSAIGGIIAGLKQHPHTQVVDRYFASTKMCNECGELNVVKLSDRIYHCEHCGNEIDRDHHSAINILVKQFPAERRMKPEESKTTAVMFMNLKEIPNVSVSFVQRSRKPRCFSSG